MHLRIFCRLSYFHYRGRFAFENSLKNKETMSLFILITYSSRSERKRTDFHRSLLPLVAFVELLDVADFFDDVGGEDFGPVLGDQKVILNTDTEAEFGDV